MLMMLIFYAKKDHNDVLRLLIARRIKKIGGPKEKGMM